MRLDDLMWVNVDRSQVVGGTDMAVIMGLNKYKTRDQLLKEKLGHFVVEQNEAMYWGRMHENTIANHYADKMMKENHYLMDPTESGKPQVAHPDYYFIVGSPDRLVCEKYTHEIIRGFEAKNVSEWTRKKWMVDAPEHYVIQCQTYMFVTGLEEWDLGACCGGNSYIQHTLTADPFLFDEFVKQATIFQNDLDRMIDSGAMEALDKYEKLLVEKAEEDNAKPKCVPMGGS